MCRNQPKYAVGSTYTPLFCTSRCRCGSRALSKSGLAPVTPIFCPVWYRVALPHFQRAVQTAVPAGHAVVVVNGHGIAPQGIAAHFADSTGIYGENVCTGGTAEVYAVVCLPCTGGFGLDEFAVTERVQDRKVCQRRGQLVYRCFFRRNCFRNCFCCGGCCFCCRCSGGCRRGSGFCGLRHVSLHADNRGFVGFRFGFGQFHLFVQGIEVLLQCLTGLAVRKDTGRHRSSAGSGKGLCKIRGIWISVLSGFSSKPPPVLVCTGGIFLCRQQKKWEKLL